MPAIITLVIVFFVGLVLPIRGIKPLASWGLSCCIMPAFVLYAEFVLPYMGGGASMWPIALAVGGCAGIIVGGIGTVIAIAYLKWKEAHTYHFI